MEQALAGVHQANPQRMPVTFGMTWLGDALHLFCRCPASLRGMVESQLYAQFPDIAIGPLAEWTSRIAGPTRSSSTRSASAISRVGSTQRSSQGGERP